MEEGGLETAVDGVLGKDGFYFLESEHVSVIVKNSGIYESKFCYLFCIQRTTFLAAVSSINEDEKIA